jgi:hypothetical protein
MGLKNRFNLLFRRDGGFSIILATTLIAVILFMSIGLLSVVLVQRMTAQKYEMAIRTLYIADAGVQKAIHCLNATSAGVCGATFGPGYIGESDQAIGGGMFSTAVTGSGDEREIESVGSLPSGFSTTLKMRLDRRLAASQETMFDFALQVENNVNIKPNAEIHNGPIYSNADIGCGNNVVIEKDMYVSKVGGWIDNCDVQGEAHADNIKKAEITGDCYYDATFQASICHGTEYPGSPTPEYKDMPEFDADFWRSEALKGGVISGDHEPVTGTTLGPKKIEGQLILGNNVVMTMTGPIWATGGVLIDNGATIQLDPSFEERSSLVLGDDPDTPEGGVIYVENGAIIAGSGEEGSYILFVSTSTEDPAIEVRNNAEAGIFFATQGAVSIWNNASVVAVAADGASMGDNAIITYDSTSLSDFAIQLVDTYDPWRFDPGTWREL